MSRSALETPMMKQFLEMKGQYPDSVIFYRMGDFYEMFLDDAELVAPLLDIALTSRNKGKPDAVPMCGVPVHAAEGHIKRLASLGHRIAICEQIEDPKEIGGKRLLRRAVVEVVTPGLIGDPTGLEAHAVVAVAAIYHDAEKGRFGLAVLDATTADFRGTLVASETERDSTLAANGLPDLLVQELARIAPRELLVPADLVPVAEKILHDVIEKLVIREVAERFYREKPTTEGWSGDFLEGEDAASRSALSLANYLVENQP
ncbi:MAG: DNA mismatch repair protein MutS, partial [Myxococcota bacterium]